MHEEGHEGDTMTLPPEVECKANSQACQKIPELDPGVLPTLREAPLFIEACCGCALLSASVSQMGFDTLPIDFHGNKHRPFLHVVELDLRKQSTWTFLEHLVLTRRPFHFHGAPPCGTASRARDKPLSDDQHGPPPLRSEEYPMGFPWITGVWKDKLNSANAIYIFLAAFCFWLNTMNVGWSIENPGRSYLWNIEDYKLLMTVAYFVLFHSCIHGSQRKKLTGLLTNRRELQCLGGFCKGDHEHLPWTHTAEDGKVVFDTSKEAAYPKLFCERFATVLSDSAGLADPITAPGFSANEVNIDARVATNKQPRGRKLPPIISEYGEVKTVRSISGDDPLLTDKRTLLEAFHGVPPGSKLLREAKAKRGQTGQDDSYIIRVFGIYRSMMEFATVARSIIHPFDSFRAVPDALLQVICRVLSRPPLETMKFRLNKLKQWRARAEANAGQNEAIFAHMNPGCASVLRGKNLALLEELAREFQWPDTNIHADIKDGFKLVGMQQPSGIFAADIKPRSLSEEDLVKQLKFLQPALWGKVQSSPKADYEQELWDITMQELTEKSWLEGPYARDELDVLFNNQWLPVRRFAVWQRSKWRPIDDFSECGVNATFSYLEKIDLKALDEVVWLACCFVKLCIFEHHFDFTLMSGDRLSGPVAVEWTQLPADAVQMVGKTIDLKSAYKQFPIFPDHRKYSVLVLKRPTDGKAMGFVSKTLPFGSVASVLHFNRVARLLHKIGLEMDIPWTNYYDDFPVVDLKILSEHTAAAARALTSLLGFECSLDKELPFSTNTEMLGVVLNLEDSSKGIIKVSNKPSRMEELGNVLQDIVRSGQVHTKDLASIFGRALFVETQFMGKAGKLALAELRTMEKQNPGVVNLSEVQSKAMSNLLQRYDNGTPRQLKVGKTALPCVIFTDGACEHDEQGELVCTVGGVLFDPDAECECESFGAHVFQSMVDKWLAAGKVHPVAQTEMYAECVARLLWKKRIDGRRCLFFIDNQGDLDALIKGYSMEETMKDLLVKLENLDSEDPCLPWYCRVPSASNIADLPSRGMWNELFSMCPDCKLLHPVCPFYSRNLQVIEKKNSHS